MTSLKILRVFLFAFLFTAVLVSCSKEEDYDEMDENVVLNGESDSRDGENGTTDEDEEDDE
ncbi:MAG: hypothetical protein P1U56_10695, partial [Saprospiraceae bacterium]|nr:hypothetical protein [Saprospiraceae bacterium]